MNKQDISTLAIIVCAILGMIGTYWLTYYIDHSPRLTAPTNSPLEERIVEPTQSWPADEGKDKG